MVAALALFDGHANFYDPQVDRQEIDKDICDHTIVISGG